MLNGKKIVVVLPAFNAATTLKRTIDEIPFSVVDDIVLVDDCSSDDTVYLANLLGIRHVIQHKQNLGYGANQKTCYQKALSLDADIIVMLHPDYQYTPKLITSIAGLIAYDVYPIVFGSRILGKNAIKGGMPLYKYISNRFLTFYQNILFGNKLSEYHTGYRAFHRDVLASYQFIKCSNDFIFDNQMIAQHLFANYQIGEVSCPTRYFKEASSINFIRSIIYGIGCLQVAFLYRLHCWKIYSYYLLR